MIRPRPEARYAPVAMLACSVLMGACADAAPPPPHAPATASVSATSTAPASINVVGARPPTGFHVDGDLTEWGKLPPAAPSIPLIDLEQSSGDAPVTPLPNPKDATARVGVGLSQEGLLVAIDLGDLASEGIWLGVASRVPTLPILGQGAGRAGFLPLQCESEVECYSVGEGEGDACRVTEKPNPPEVVAQCQKLLAAYAVLEAGYGKRFAKLFRIDQRGVRLSGDGGSLADLAGARFAWKRGSKGMTGEVSIPLAALPRMADAPVTRIALFASLASAAEAPDDAPSTWIGVKLPAPVTLEPLGDLRRRAFVDALKADERNLQVGQGIFEEPPALSYQPGDPLHFEGLKTEGDHVNVVTRVEHTLYSVLTTVGDLELGLADLAGVAPWLVVTKAGKQLAIEELGPGLRPLVQRAGEVHLGWGSQQTWHVRAIAPDGSRREAVEPFVPSADRNPRKGDKAEWTDIVEIPGVDLDGFGWRGVKRGAGTEVTWHWDGGQKAYVAREKHFVAPRKPRRR